MMNIVVAIGLFVAIPFILFNRENARTFGRWRFFIAAFSMLGATMFVAVSENMRVPRIVADVILNGIGIAAIAICIGMTGIFLFGSFRLWNETQLGNFRKPSAIACAACSIFWLWPLFSAL